MFMAGEGGEGSRASSIHQAFTVGVTGTAPELRTRLLPFVRGA